MRAQRERVDLRVNGDDGRRSSGRGELDAFSLTDATEGGEGKVELHVDSGGGVAVDAED